MSEKKEKCIACREAKTDCHFYAKSGCKILIGEQDVRGITRRNCEFRKCTFYKTSKQFYADEEKYRNIEESRQIHIMFHGTQPGKAVKQ